MILWGTYHGLLLVVHRLVEPLLKRYRPTDPVESAGWAAVRMIVTFHLVCFGWLLFRSESLDQAFGMIRAIVERPAIPVYTTLIPVLVCILPLLAVQLVQYASKDLDVIFRLPWYVRSVVYTGLFYAFVLGGRFDGERFIYFQF